MADEKQRALLSKRRGKLAAGISDPAQRKQFVAAQGEQESRGKGLDELELATSRETNRQALASYKHGGKVSKTGPAMLHKGEVVVPESETHSYDFRRQRGRRAPLMMKKGK